MKTTICVRHLALVGVVLFCGCKETTPRGDGAATPPDSETAVDTGTAALCSDGVKNGNEQCDGQDLGGHLCTTEGFDGGTLGCETDCTFDTSACFKCGDGIINGAEQCDGVQLGGETCQTQGFDSGDLACQANCLFDQSKCSIASCGDGSRQSNEPCEGTDLGGKTCSSEGFDGGQLDCNANCSLDTSACFKCGDGTINGAEQCDGAQLGGETCESQGFAGGQLGCEADCTFATSGCTSVVPDAGTGADTGTGPDAGLDSGPITTGIIPQDRRMDWSRSNVGVPGGIPDRTTIFVNIATTTDPQYTCVGDGTTDCSTALQNAINDCPDGQVVYAPAGTYRLNSNVVSSSNSNLTLRGDGMGQTIFVPYSTGGYGVFAFGSSDWPRPTAGEAITSGATAGSTTVTVADTTAVNVGKLVRIDPDNPSWVHNLNGEDNNPTMSFIFRVISKTPTTVTFTPALPFDLSAMSPKLVPYSNLLIEGIGVEDLTVDLSNASTAAFSMEQAWGCWFKRVEIKNSDARQVFLVAVSRSEVRQCYTHGTRSGGPNHEGIDFYNDSCWNLIEDNIVYNGGFPGIILGDSKGGCQGNVIAYNYCGGVDVGSSDTTGADISFSHGPHNMLNLAEGNVVGMIQADGYFGSSSHNTIFRNAITVTHPTAIYGLRAVALQHYNTYYNVVGNVLGTPAFPASPDGEYSTEVNGYNGQIQLIYQLGYPNMGNTGYSGTIGPTTPPDYTNEPFSLSAAQALDYNVKATLLRHGNYDYFNKTTMWDPNIADHALPPSFIYTSKPSWFGNVPWPPIGPDAPGMVNKIPAQLRYEAGAP